MTRTFTSLFAVVVAGLCCAGSAGAQPRPAPAPAAPAPPAAPSVSIGGDFNFDWDVDMSGVAETVRDATEQARQAMADARLKWNLQTGRAHASLQDGRDDAWYRQARELIDRGRYEEALRQLARIVEQSGHQFADAALYWKAYSQGRLNRMSDALTTLADLQKRFPDSRWLKDAKALEVETRQASGQAVSPDAQNDEELKLLALRGLMRTDPERALPMVERMMTGTGSIKLRENALFVLSQSQSPKARDIIANIARTGNPDLQLKAIRYLGVMNGDAGQIQQLLIDIYRTSADQAVKRQVIDTLAARRSAKTLADLARAEKDPGLKRLLVSRLSNMSSPDATDYLLELFK